MTLLTTRAFAGFGPGFSLKAWVFTGLLFWVAGPVYSQIEIESDNGSSDFVIEVDSSQSKNLGRSLPLALLLSAAVPGTGSLYLKETRSAKAFMLSEVGFWAGLLFSWMAYDSYLQSARNAAALYAGVDADEVDEKFLASMTQYRSYEEVHHRKDSYVQSQVLAGERDRNYEIPPLEENKWDFGTPLVEDNTENWNRFIASTKAYGRARVVMTWAVGGLILGRVVSVLHSLHVYRRTAVEGISEGPSKSSQNRQASLHWQLRPVAGPDVAGARFQVRF